MDAPPKPSTDTLSPVRPSLREKLIRSHIGGGPPRSRRAPVARDRSAGMAVVMSDVHRTTQFPITAHAQSFEQVASAIAVTRRESQGRRAVDHWCAWAYWEQTRRGSPTSTVSPSTPLRDRSALGNAAPHITTTGTRDGDDAAADREEEHKNTISRTSLTLLHRRRRRLRCRQPWARHTHALVNLDGHDRRQPRADEAPPLAASDRGSPRGLTPRNHSPPWNDGRYLSGLRGEQHRALTLLPLPVVWWYVVCDGGSVEMRRPLWCGRSLERHQPHVGSKDRLPGGGRCGRASSR